MKTYSVLIAWNDDDPDEEEFGWTGRATDPSDAESKARDEMRKSCLDQYGNDLFQSCADGEQIGGRVIELQIGAMWLAAELEDALRLILKHAEQGQVQPVLAKDQCREIAEIARAVLVKIDDEETSHEDNA